MLVRIIGIAIGALAVSAAAGAVAAVAVTGAGTAAWATGSNPSPDGDSDWALTGTVLDRAKGAALAHTRGGRVTETETGDDGAAYGVEIRRSDGRHVEVALDQNFQVVGEEADDGPDMDD
jgi:hypothetical protein